MTNLNRYWVSWWSGNYASEGCTAAPFQMWESGFRDRKNDKPGDDLSLCAVIDAPSEDAIWECVAKHFPDYEQRFCTPCEPEWQPNNRFPDFENRTAID